MWCVKRKMSLVDEVDFSLVWRGPFFAASEATFSFVS